MADKELLFSVTASDCRWDYYRGSGKGGQKRNKTDSAVRCTHLASGAVGSCENYRSQRENKIEAFRRMYDTAKFKGWHKLECAKRMGLLKRIEEDVDLMMKDRNLLVEIKSEDGKWISENGES